MGSMLCSEGCQANITSHCKVIGESYPEYFLYWALAMQGLGGTFPLCSCRISYGRRGKSKAEFNIFFPTIKKKLKAFPLQFNVKQFSTVNLKARQEPQKATECRKAPLAMNTYRVPDHGRQSCWRRMVRLAKWKVAEGLCSCRAAQPPPSS